MKRDEVMAMTDEELRIKAAELMGWTRSCDVLNGISGEKLPQWVRDTADGNEVAIGVAALPDYLNDIAAAWGLWDRLIDEDWYPMFRAGSMNTGARHYSRSLRRLEATVLLWHGTKDSIEVVEEDDRAAPRAITMAFILAMPEV